MCLQTDPNFCFGYRLTSHYHLWSLVLVVSYVGKNSVKKQEESSHSKLDLNVRKELLKRYIWSIACCGAETGTLREVD
jgi:hypothetical protein